MRQNNKILNDQVDRILGQNLKTISTGGLSYTEVEGLLEETLNGDLDAILIQLGKSKLREVIHNRVKALTALELPKMSLLGDGLFEEDASQVYSVKNPAGDQIIKTTASLTKDEFRHILRNMVKQRQGVDSHVKALRRMERKLNPIWKAHPDCITIGDAQTHIATQKLAA